MRFTWIHFLLIGLLALFPGGPLSGQQTPAISVNVKVVNVLATVRDKHDEIVRNLGKDDFILEEDGRPQVIRYFSQQTDLPLTLGLLVDTSLSQRQVIDEERTASYSFLDHMLRTRDQAFVIHFDREVELLQDLTPSREKLQTALGSLQVQQLQRQARDDSGSAPGQGRRGMHAGTLLYDSVFLASDELMKKQPGRKALIILSDGADRGSRTTLEHAIETAQRADTLVYAIFFPGEEGYGGGHDGFGEHRRSIGMDGGGMGRGPGGGYPGGGGQRPPTEERPDGKKILERMCRETGGRMFQVSKKHPVDKIYAQLEDELRNQYNLGYTPDRANGAEGYRKIRLTTQKKDLVVQAREGYYMTP